MSVNDHDTADYGTDNGDVGWNGVGKSGLGGMALADDNSQLFVMNLEDRKLYALDPTTGASLGSSASVTTLTLPTVGPAVCSSNTSKLPFAVKYYRGSVYIGVVCTAQSTGSTADLYAYVFAVNPATLVISGTPVFSVPLNYSRGFADPGAAAEWQPWTTTIQAAFSYPQPMLTDIEFENGNLILGLRDRSGDTSLDAGSNPKRTAGDTIRACGTFGAWTLESNGRCGGTGTAAQSTGQGPGNGEFYFQDDFCLTPNGANYHDEVSWGALLYLPGRQQVVSTLLDPVSRTIDSNATFDGGLRYFTVVSLTTGTAGASNHTFDIGLTLSPSAAGVDIAGRVITSNGNGIRNVELRLVEDDGTLHSAITGPFGYYSFTDIPSGQTVIMSVSAKHFHFAQSVRLITLNDGLTAYDWVSQE